MGFRFKRGATFNPTVTYTPPVGGVPNLSGAVITSSIRNASGRFAQLTATLAINGLSFSLLPTKPTNTWPLGDAEWDIKIVLGGQTLYSESIRFSIVDPVTP